MPLTGLLQISGKGLISHKFARLLLILSVT
jgi:hypothetical protein